MHIEYAALNVCTIILLQRVGYDLTTKLNWTEYAHTPITVMLKMYWIAGAWKSWL